MTEQRPRDPNTPLRVAIIGYGLAGQVFHAPLVSSTPGMQVAAVVTTNPERRQRAHRDYPDAAILDSPQHIWNSSERFDLVVVATHNTSHAPLATESMQHRIPVVVDKPMALSVDEAEALIETSRQTGMALTVFQNRRWDGDFLTLRQLIADGALGRISRFESRFERYRPELRPDAWRETTPFEEGGGLLWDLGSHLIDQAVQLFDEPTRVYAEMPRRRNSATVDDDTFVAITFANDVNAHLWMSVTSRILGPRFRLHGLRGSYEKYGLDPQEDMLKDGRRPGDDGWAQERRSSWGWMLTDMGGLTVEGSVETLSGAYETFYAQVRDALVAGKPLPVDPRDAVKTLKVIAEARRSAETGVAVQV